MNDDADNPAPVSTPADAEPGAVDVPSAEPPDDGGEEEAARAGEPASDPVSRAGLADVDQARFGLGRYGPPVDDAGDQEPEEATRPRTGYRVSRLSARRKERRHTWERIGLYVLAAAVALGAVIGAYFLVRSWTATTAADPALGRLALVLVKDNEGTASPSAWLTIYDSAHRSYAVFTVPRTLLLEGSRGEYVMAGDGMGRPQLRADLGRLINAGIPTEIRLTYDDLRKLAGAGPLAVDLTTPVTLRIDGAWRTYKGTSQLKTSELRAYLGSRGRSGEDEDGMAQAVLTAAFHNGALTPTADRVATVRAMTASITDEQQGLAARRVLNGLFRRPVTVQRIPSRGQVSEGQFAFRPSRPEIMAEVTRLTPGFGSRYSVLIRNGTGEAGIGALVRDKLGTLDANLPSPGNADSFSYKRTQILAGNEALAVAEDVRAILGRGVVLSGKDLPPRTVVVIIGADLNAKDLQ